jgi:hypothetical protein
MKRIVALGLRTQLRQLGLTTQPQCPHCQALVAPHLYSAHLATHLSGAEATPPQSAAAVRAEPPLPAGPTHS